MILTAMIDLHRLYNIHQRLQSRDVLSISQTSEHSAHSCLVCQAQLLELETDQIETPIHIVHIGYRARRPEAFRYSSQTRPNPRIDRLLAYIFSPHAGLAAKNVRSLIWSQGRVRSERINRIMLGGRQHMIEIVSR